jgi:hypothetical protein
MTSMRVLKERGFCQKRKRMNLKVCLVAFVCLFVCLLICLFVCLFVKNSLNTEARSKKEVMGTDDEVTKEKPKQKTYEAPLITRKPTRKVCSFH